MHWFCCFFLKSFPLSFLHLHLLSSVMAANYSSFPNASFSPPLSCISTNMFLVLYDCMVSKDGQVGLIIYTSINIFIILPLCISVLYLGLQQWWQQRTRAPMNHIDAFTYNITISEIMNIMGFMCLCIAVHNNVQSVAGVGVTLFAVNLNGQMSFHTMICMERYLAVIHPITYLSLKKTNGVRKRNAAIVIIWLFNIMQTGFMFFKVNNYLIFLYLCIITLFLVIVSFSSLYVLYALLHSKPGEGGSRSQLDQSKIKAFYIMVVIVGVLMVRFVGQCCSTLLYILLDVGEGPKCLLLLCLVWFSFPSSLPLPLLFMYRMGRLRCCINDRKLCWCII